MAVKADPGGVGVGAQHAAPLPGGAPEPRLEPRYAEVVLPMPVPRGYTYQIPTALVERVVPGSRVVVPVHRRQVVAVDVTIDTSAPDVLAKPIASAPDVEPALSPQFMQLVQWISWFYDAPLCRTMPQRHTG